jgi:hypothetical protein
VWRKGDLHRPVCFAVEQSNLTCIRCRFLALAAECSPSLKSQPVHFSPCSLALRRRMTIHKNGNKEEEENVMARYNDFVFQNSKRPTNST